MAASSVPLSSSRLALLGGVSLLALAACADKTGLPATGNEPTATAPPSAVVDGSLAQEYSPADDNIVTTLAIGEEDGGSYQPAPEKVTTLAIGEEDNSGPIPVEPDGGIGDGAEPLPFATTLAIGEEDGTGPIPVEPDGGIGDGAGPPPFVTTFALGEEDGQYAVPVDSGPVTTLAIGEEDGGAAIYAPPGPTVTTLAVGEEG